MYKNDTLLTSTTPFGTESTLDWGIDCLVDNHVPSIRPSNQRAGKMFDILLEITLLIFHLLLEIGRSFLRLVVPVSYRSKDISKDVCLVTGGGERRMYYRSV